MNRRLGGVRARSPAIRRQVGVQPSHRLRDLTNQGHRREAAQDAARQLLSTAVAVYVGHGLCERVRGRNLNHRDVTRAETEHQLVCCQAVLPPGKPARWNQMHRRRRGASESSHVG